MRWSKLTRISRFLFNLSYQFEATTSAVVCDEVFCHRFFCSSSAAHEEHARNASKSVPFQNNLRRRNPLRTYEEARLCRAFWKRGMHAVRRHGIPNSKHPKHQSMWQAEQLASRKGDHCICHRSQHCEWTCMWIPISSNVSKHNWILWENKNLEIACNLLR